MKNIKILLSSLILIGLVACNSRKKADEKEPEVIPPNSVELTADQIKTAGIQLGNTEIRNIGKTIKVNGTINVTPQNIASVCCPLGGFIKQTKMLTGTMVSKGQTIAWIENIEFINLQQNYFEIKAKYEYAELEYNRQKELYNNNASSAKTSQLTESEYKTLKAQLNALIQKLSMLGIDAAMLKEDKISGVLPLISPINGYVKAVNVNIGKYVYPTDVLFEIVNTKNQILELTLFEKDIAKVSKGEKLHFFPTNNPQNDYTASVYLVGKVLDNDKTVKVYANIDNSDNKIYSGMFVNAEIETENNEVTALPSESVVQFDEKFFIFALNGTRMENGKEVTFYEVIEINKGSERDGYTEIMLPKGLDLSKRKIVIKGAYAILSALHNAGEMSC